VASFDLMFGFRATGREVIQDWEEKEKEKEKERIRLLLSDEEMDWARGFRNSL
jgi:hypothetical protein